jgi:hypothetical protein
MVPAAPHTRTRRSPEGSPHHPGRRDYYRPHPCHQQTVPRLAAAYLGPDISRYSTDWRCIVPSTLARSGSGQSSPRLYGRASVGEGQTRDERRLCRTRPNNTSIHNANPATNQSRLSVWRRRIGRRRRYRRFLKDLPADTTGSHFIAMPWGRAGPVLKAVLKSSLNRLSSVRVSCVTLRTWTLWSPSK